MFPRITKFTVEGFKSFGSPGCTVELGPLNVLVGANGCGKSNFVSAFRFLSEAFKGELDDAAHSFGGIDFFQNRTIRKPNPTSGTKVRFALDVDGLDLPEAKNMDPSATAFYSFDLVLQVPLF